MRSLVLNEKMTLEEELVETCINGMTRDEVALLREDIIENSVRKKKVYWALKRTFDIVASLTALIVLSPLFILVALLIVIDDPSGGPIFVQERVGRNGKRFKFYKFRSMVVGADGMKDSLKEKNEKSGPVFKIRNDPRMTRVGKIIRRVSIDELPQLINILKGEMSIVGPRPALPDEVERYDDFTRLRLLVTPGLTCYWQVSKNRDSISFDDWMKLDVKYIQDRSVWLDIKLIILTFGVSLTGQGS